MVSIALHSSQQIQAANVKIWHIASSDIVWYANPVTDTNTQLFLSRVHCHFMYLQQVPLNQSPPLTHNVSKLYERKRVLFSLVHQADSILLPKQRYHRPCTVQSRGSASFGLLAPQFTTHWRIIAIVRGHASHTMYFDMLAIFLNICLL